MFSNKINEIKARRYFVFIGYSANGMYKSGMVYQNPNDENCKKLKLLYTKFNPLGNDRNGIR